MLSIKKVFFAALLTVIALSLVGCSNAGKQTASVEGSEKQTIKIAYLSITHALPLYIENELAKGNLKKANLELIKFGSWPELMDALNTGKVDGASVLIELAMKAKEQGIDLKTVALGHRDGNVVVVANDINSVADLKGKTFAIPHRLSTHNILLYKMLKQAGLNYDDVKIVELPPPEMPAALSEGRVAGYVVAEPFGAKSVAGGKGKVLFESEDIWKDSVCCGLVLRNEYLKNNQAVAQEFIDEYVKSGVKAETKDEQVYNIAFKYMKVERNVLDLSLKWISYKDLKLNENDYEELRNSLVEMKLSKNPPAYKYFVDNSFIDKVK